MWMSSKAMRVGGLAAMVALSAALAVHAPAASAGTGLEPHLHHHVLVTFRPNAQFAESLAQSPGGALFASVTTWGQSANHGRVFRVTRAGTKTPFGPVVRTGPGVLTGVAFDGAGALYVADATFGKSPAPGVFRVGPSGAKRVLTLPADTFPNGLVFHRGSLFISDSDHGAIWRWTPRRQPAPAVLTEPWLVSKRLAPGGAGSGIGPNGLAVRHGMLYIAVADAGANRSGTPVGRLAAVSLGAGGSHGAVHVVRTSPRLATVDGITFARSGTLWMVTNGLYSRKGIPLGGERLLRLTTGGELDVLAHDTPWLNYPTAVVVDGPPGHRTLYLANGAFFGGTANILRLR